MGLRSYLPPGGLVAGQVEVGEVVRGTKRGPRPLTGTGRGHAFERGAEVGRTCQAGAGRLEGWLRELRPERRLGLRVPGWDFGAPGARPQATLWVFDLRTSWHLDKLLVLGVGGSARLPCASPTGPSLLSPVEAASAVTPEEETRLQRGK